MPKPSRIQEVPLAQSLVPKVIGKTIDDRPVFGGLFAFYETTGYPIELLFEWVISRGGIPDTLELASDMSKAGMNPRSIVTKIHACWRESTCDVSKADEIKIRLLAMRDLWEVMD
jgi:hypothetical protein